MSAQHHPSPWSFPISRRMQAVQAPIIPILGEWIRAHPGTISLGQGVVFYPPPDAALAAAREYPIDVEAHHYSAVGGETSLHEAIWRKLETDNAITVNPTSSGNAKPDARRIVVTAGSNMGFLNALLAIADADDEIILLSPYYFNHEMAIRMLGCVCIPVATDSRYQPDPATIENSITPRTRAVVTVSPNNPTGAVYPRATLTAINELCRRRGIYHISDEAYEYFTYDGQEHFSPASLAQSGEHTISLYSLSKAYGFAGWRIGYMLIPATLAEAVQKAQDTNLICPTRIAQSAATAALNDGADYCRAYLHKLDSRRQEVLSELNALAPRCQVPTADGAFYVLLRLDTSMDSMTLAQRLIAEYGVAVVPGLAFGCRDGCYLRVSYGALTDATALEGVRRLVRGLSRLLHSTTSG